MGRRSPFVSGTQRATLMRIPPLKPRGKENVPNSPSVLILGAGFGGLTAAQELARLFPRHDECKITLVDQNNFTLFTPMLTEVAGGQVDERDVISAVRALSPRITFVQGCVDSIDLDHRQVEIRLGRKAAGIPEAGATLSADHLIIALGSVTNFDGISGLKEHSLAMKSVSDAATIRNRALALLERADAERESDRRRAILTFVIGGGGFSGVETAAALNAMVQEVAEFYPHVSASDIRVLVVEPKHRLLPELSEGLARYAHTKLQEGGVETALQTSITGVGDGYVEVDPPIHGQRRIDAHTLIWTAGVTPSPVLGTLNVPLGRHGGIVVEETLAVPDHQGVWALGDCAEVPRSHGRGTYAPTAQNALREGTHVARNIVAGIRGQPLQPFAYQPIGELALVGKRSGVASIYGLHLSGTPAWAMWRATYLYKMPSIDRRIRVLFNWAMDLLVGRDITEVPAAATAGPSSSPARTEQRN